jgi:hypothetical protein
MVREQGPFKLNNRWDRIAWGSMAAVFLVLGRFQQNGPTLGTWDAFGRAIGLTADRQTRHSRHDRRRRELPGIQTRWRGSRRATSNTAPSSRSTVPPAMAIGA